MYNTRKDGLSLCLALALGSVAGAEACDTSVSEGDEAAGRARGALGDDIDAPQGGDDHAFDYPGEDPGDLCQVGELVDDGEGGLQRSVAPEPPPSHNPHYRDPPQPPDMKPGWGRAGPPTTPRAPVAPEVIAALHEYQERAVGLSDEEAARLKEDLLGE
jgi:hypothetical protein